MRTHIDRFVDNVVWLYIEDSEALCRYSVPWDRPQATSSFIKVNTLRREILMVWTHPKRRRLGLASRLLRTATKRYGPLSAPDKTRLGELFFASPR